MTPKAKWILANKHKVNGLQKGELVQENAATDCDNEQSKLGEGGLEVVNTENLGGNDTADANRGDPHDDTDHPHDNLIHNREELNHTRCFLSQTSQNSSKSQTEEDDSQSVGSIPIQNIL